jgi:probable addiction module antidote protein
VRGTRRLGDGRRGDRRARRATEALAGENEESLFESLKNPAAAAHYLHARLEDEDARVFLPALRDVAEARGGIRALSRNANLNRESLYRMLSKSGDPFRSRPVWVRTPGPSPHDFGLLYPAPRGSKGRKAAI